jgi:7,8-dihydroneopterin aldolase/epimerase/oxygenase
MATNHPVEDMCWIHIRDVYTFLHLGANAHEQKVGQNLKIDLSVRIPYRRTSDDLQNTVDYGILIKRVQSYIEAMESVALLEYLAEKVLDLIENEFPAVCEAKLSLLKAFVPLNHFTGSVAIEVERVFAKRT